MGAGDEVKLLVVDTYGNIPAVNSVIHCDGPFQPEGHLELSILMSAWMPARFPRLRA